MLFTLSLNLGCIGNASRDALIGTEPRYGAYMYVSVSSTMAQTISEPYLPRVSQVRCQINVQDMQHSMPYLISYAGVHA